MWEDNEDSAETKEVNNIYRSSDSSRKPPYNPENQWKTLNCFNCDSGEHLIANCPYPRKIGNIEGLQTLLLETVTRETDLQLRIHILRTEVKEIYHHLIVI